MYPRLYSVSRPCTQSRHTAAFHRVHPTLGFAAAALLTALSCSKSDPNPDPTLPGSAGSRTGSSTPSTVTTNPAPKATDGSGNPLYPWPPKYLLHFRGTDSSKQVNGIAVNSSHIFWFENDRLRRGGLTPGSDVVTLAECGAICQASEIEADDQFVYSLAGGDIYRFNPSDGSRAANIPLWSGHGGVGDLASDDKYLYTALRGCAGLARYDKQTLQQVGDIMYPPDPATYPKNAGYNALRIFGERIVCAAPDNPIVVWEKWGEPGRVLRPASTMRGLAILGDEVYRSEFDYLTQGYLTLSSLSQPDTPQPFPYEQNGNSEILGIPQLDLLLIPHIGGFIRFDTKAKQFVSNFGEGRPLFMIQTPEFVYASMLGSYWVDSMQQPVTGYYIDRFPIADFDNFR